MGAPRLITEWVNFQYDPQIIKEQKTAGGPLIMKGILQKAEKRDYESAYGNNYGNSKAYITEFTLPDKSIVRIYCADFDETNKLVKKKLWNDGLEVGFASKEFASFLLNEAY